MARKKVDLKAAKAARQKKLAIGGAVLLVALLVFQVPRTLKMLKGPTPKHQSAAATTTATTTTAASSAAAPSAPVTGTPTSAPVLTAQLAPPAREGQLEVLSATFKSKDPFRQLIDEDEAPAESLDTRTKKQDERLKVLAAKAKPAAAPAPVAPTAFTAPAAPKVKKITLPLLSATISVNGVREGVDLKEDFPTDSPLFHLVSLTKRAAKISVAGGSLASGAPTLTLRRGKPLTLVNTADGTRYRLVLVALSTAAAVQPAQTSSDSPTTGTTTTTPSTTTPTTTTPTIGG
jgi:hypothetical protein